MGVKEVILRFTGAEDWKEQMRRIREGLLQLCTAIYVVASAYMLWKGIGVICNTCSPVVVVLSESMYPGFHRGDILLIANWKKEPKSGDICVFQFKKSEIPVVHRIIDKFYLSEKENSLRVMTKGDNNRVNDDFLYRQVGKSYLEKGDIINYVYATIPYFGMVTIWSNAWPGLKYFIIGMLFFYVLFLEDTGKKATTIKKTNPKYKSKDNLKEEKDHKEQENPLEEHAQ
ncbi:signal peptidase I [Nematocida sp. LUAm3]|nr:signal peptidase I [Nematocida sp. LUAm3]KAI5174107.1 signal peptidase I [Nematocida sp. LUAm2]KAI5177150.1 signal peptidase I [Nematocida sp. LUAm1]